MKTGDTYAHEHPLNRGLYLGSRWRRRAAVCGGVARVASFLIAAAIPADLHAQASPSAQFEVVVFGQEETVLPHGNPWQLRHTPDGPLSFRRTGEELRMWFTASHYTALLHGPRLDELTPQLDPTGWAELVFAPSGSGFDSHYAGAYSVVPANDGHDLLMFYHAERHPCRRGLPFLGSIGLARSSDGGLTWERQGEVLRTAAAEPETCEFSAWGVGNPSVYLSPDRRYLYMLFAEWFRGDPVSRPDMLYLARAPLESDGMPGAWQKYANGSFSEPGLGGVGTPVIREQPPGRAYHYAGLPAVSFNTALGRYLVVFQSRSGLYIATSADGIAWDTPRLLWEEPDVHVGMEQRTRWVAYPSLLSPGEASQMTTGQRGYLYFARGHPRGSPPHEMTRRRFAIGVGPLTLRSSVVERADSVFLGEDVSPRADSVEITLSGYGLSSARWRASARRGSWLRLSTRRASEPISWLRWTRDPEGLAPGTYVDTITVTVPGAAGSPLRIVDTLRVIEPSDPAEDPPLTQRGGSHLTLPLSCSERCRRRS